MRSAIPLVVHTADVVSRMQTRTSLLDYTDRYSLNEAGQSLQPVSESKIKGTVTKVGTDDDDDDEIAYFTVRWKTRKLVLSTAPRNMS